MHADRRGDGKRQNKWDETAKTNLRCVIVVLPFLRFCCCFVRGVAGAQGGVGARIAEMEANLDPHQAKRRRRGRHIPGTVHGPHGQALVRLSLTRRCPQTHDAHPLLEPVSTRTRTLKAYCSCLPGVVREGGNAMPFRWIQLLTGARTISPLSP